MTPTFTPKTWRNEPDPSTPISAEALVDVETRLSAYTDTIRSLAVNTDTFNTVSNSITSDPAQAWLNISFSNNQTIPINIGQILGPTGLSSTTRKRGININAQYNQTNASAPNTQLYRGVEVGVTIGDSTNAATGAVIGMSSAIAIVNSGNALNEHALHFGYLRYDGSGTTPGRAWLTDWGLHGAIGIQQSLLQGPIVHINNHYNGSPSGAPAAGFVVSSYPGVGAGVDGAHSAATTYPVDYGIHILGQSTGSTSGFNSGIYIGGSGSGWNIPGSVFGYGIQIKDWKTAGIHVDQRLASGTGPSFMTTPQAAGQVVFQTKRASEGTARFYFDESGVHNWGPGTGAIDTTLQRTGIGILKITGSLTFGPHTLTQVGSLNPQIRGNYDAAANRLVDQANSSWNVAPGNQADEFVIGRQAATASAPTYTRLFTVTNAGTITAVGLVDGRANGVASKVKAGVVADGDFTITPVDGTFAVDSTNSKIYVRIGGTWKSVTVA